MSDTEPSLATVHALDEQEMRTRVADDAREAVGTGSTGPEERQETYANRLFPNTDNPRLKAQMADAMYSCALSALAAMGRAHVTAQQLHEDYAKHVGEALSWLQAIAVAMNAYVPLATKAACEEALTSLLPGEIVVVENPVHVIVITDKASDVIDGDTSDDLITSEGGKPEYDPTKNEHGMCIHSRRMRLRVQGGRLQTGEVHDDGTVTWGRFAIYRIATGQLRSDDGL